MQIKSSKRSNLHEVDDELQKLGQVVSTLVESMNAPVKRLANISIPFQNMLDSWQIQENQMKKWVEALPDLHQLIKEKIQFPEFIQIPNSLHSMSDSDDIYDGIISEEDAVSSIDGRILEQLPVDLLQEAKVTFYLTDRGDFYREGFPESRLRFRGKKVLALLRAISPKYKRTADLRYLSRCKDEQNTRWQFRKINGRVREAFDLKNRLVDGAPGPGYRLTPGYKIQKCTTE